jgi:putative selenium metabolism protein SsnA
MLKLPYRSGKMTSMLITNGNLITYDEPNEILTGYAVLIDGDTITEVGPQVDLLARFPGADQVDARGQYVLPGNICSHTHFYGAYARGMAIPGSAPKDFPEILNKLWWPLDKALRGEDVYYSAMACLLDAIRHGTTTLIDHHASPNAISGSLDWIARAVNDTGLRACLCYEVTDRDGPDKTREGINENLRFLHLLQTANPQKSRLSAMFGLHASLTLSDGTLHACREAVEGYACGFHIHVAEHSVDEYDSLAKSGMRTVDRLAQAGILGPKSIAVHAVHIDAHEMALLAESGTWVSHQPRSNMNNAVGLPRVEEMLRMGIRVCLGNDGFSNAMWEEWKTAYLAHKLVNQDPRRMGANLIEQMAVKNNRDLVKAQFNGLQTGMIVPGAAADLIFVDYHPYTDLNPGNLPWHIIFGFHESQVSTTIASGKVLMADHQITIVDEAKIFYEARLNAPKVWERYAKQINAAH